MFWLGKVKKLIKDLKSNKYVGGEILTKLLKECECIFDGMSKPVLYEWRVARLFETS